MSKNFSLELYAVTDRSWLKGAALEDQVEEAILGGATMIQLREKLTSSREFIQLAQAIKEITDSYAIPLIIDDRLDIALAVDASGLHVGQQDMPADLARTLLGPDKILGVSVSTLEEAVEAEQAGTDYLGVGALFPTDTKEDAGYVDFPALQNIIKRVSIPVVGIGGIKESNVLKLKGSGIHGIAVVSAIFGQQDIRGGAARLKELTQMLLRDGGTI